MHRYRILILSLSLSILVGCPFDPEKTPEEYFPPSSTGSSDGSTTVTSVTPTTTDTGTSDASTDTGIAESTSTSEDPSTTMAPECDNDGVVDMGEACDDGNRDDTDACTNACEPATCGDGIVQLGVDACDDGNRDDTDGCTNACEMAECGDGILWSGTEECDDGNVDNTDACVEGCKNASCGDGFVGPEEACDDANAVDNDACVGACQTIRLRIFTTSMIYDGNLEGLDGADTKCSDAAAGKLSRDGTTWRAWLSDRSNPASGRLDTNFKGDYILPNNVLIGVGWMGLATVEHLAPLNVDESGNAIKDIEYVWTQTTAIGDIFGDQKTDDCAYWTSASGLEMAGAVGDHTSKTNTWTYAGGKVKCSEKLHLYCVETIE